MPPPLADRLAERVLELVRIPSVTGDEEAVAAWVLEDARNRGARAQRHGNCVIASRQGDPDGPTIGLFGHLDTVAPAADQPCEWLGDRVLGCGASDMKGALAVMLELLGRPTRASLVAVFYDREEGPYTENGLRTLLAGGLVPRLDLALALEPTGNAIQAGCMGGLHALLTFRGRRAHSARPWQGENAIHKAAGFLTRLAALPRREVRVGGLPFYEVMSATTAATDNGRNVVPDRFVLNVNYRFAPGKPLATARDELVAFVAGEADLEIVDEAPAGDVSHEHPILAAWRKRFDLPVEPKQAWTDVAQLTARGIPAINFGPGDPALAHQAGEYVEIASLVRSYALLLDLLDSPFPPAGPPDGGGDAGGRARGALGRF